MSGPKKGARIVSLGTHSGMSQQSEQDFHTFGSPKLQVRVASKGAELVSVKTDTGHELMWQAGAAWKRHSPVLFPIVGRLADDTAVIDGKSYRITQHGFARDLEFQWLERAEDRCALVLSDTPQTHALFPFAFRLILEYQVTGAALTVRYRLENPSADATLFASVGVHPAFVWPLSGDSKSGHRIVFSQTQAPTIRHVKDGLLLDEKFASPVQGTTLALQDDLFADDAMIFENVAGKSLMYENNQGAAMRFSWDSFPQLGLWMKPGAEFLCIEPWHGYASPVGFKGDFREKPGLLQIAPEESWSAHWAIEWV